MTARPSLFTYLTAEKHASGFSSATSVAQVVGRYGADHRVFLVTGATSPIGEALCRELCKHGGTVLMGYHTQEAHCAQVAEQLSHEYTSVGGEALPILCDLSSLKTAQQCANDILALGLPLHVIIHCASHATSTCELTQDDVESQFAINYLNPLLLTLMLLPHMTHHEKVSASSQADQDTSEDGANKAKPAASTPRVVWCSCSAHYISYHPPKSSSGCRLAWRVHGADAQATFMPAQTYGQSKMASIMVTRLLARQAAAAGLDLSVFAVHPGCTQQGLTRYAGYPTGSFIHGVKAMFAQGLAGAGLLKSPEQAAATVAYAALADDLLEGAGTDVATTWGGQVPSLSGGPGGAWGYFEDCSLSMPSVDARDPEVADLLWQLTEAILSGYLGPNHTCTLLSRPGALQSAPLPVITPPVEN